MSIRHPSLNQAAPGNGATVSLFHAGRQGRSVAEARCWPNVLTGLLLPLILFCPAAKANPFVPKAEVWMDSEKVAVTMSSSNANVVGTFSFVTSFRFPLDLVDVHLDFPIWLPDESAEDPAMASFWRAYEERPNAPQTLRLLESALHLRVAVGGNYVHVEKALQYTEQTSNIFSSFIGRARVSKFDVFEEPGFRCLLLWFTFSPRLLQPQVPLVAWAAYRQPLARSNGEGRLFYVPIFYNQPTNTVTTDTNRYAFTITAAADCSLAVTNGERAYAVAPSHGVILSPIHCQPIRATASPRAKPQGGANRGQPFSSETNRISTTAASRR